MADGENIERDPLRVVIIGSGFGGLFAARALADPRVQVTVVARTSHHLFQPLLYQVATGVLAQGEIAPATREILRRQRNARVLMGEVTRLDLHQRTIAVEAPVGGRYELLYDRLIVAAGAGQSYFGNEAFAEHAPGLKSIDDALEVRGRIFGAFEMAELEQDPEEIARWLTFVVVGAGATGVEMAGQLAELAHHTLRHDFRHIDPAQARVILVDAAPAVLPGFGDRLSGKALARLRRIGVDVRLGVMVVGVDEDGVDVEEPDGGTTRIRAACKVWAAGVAASGLGAQLAAQSDAELDAAGRVMIAPDCSLPGRPEVAVIGDMMGLDDLPGVAPVAMQSGRHVAAEIRRALDGEARSRPFRYRDKGSLATVSRYHAVASIGRVRTAGFVAWLLWLAVHLLYLIGFKNRVTTLLHWVITFVGRGRPERTATVQQVQARTAIAHARADQHAPDDHMH